MRFVLVLSFAFAAIAEAHAAGETCTSYLTAQREKMIEAALACEGTPAQRSSVRPKAEAGRKGDKVMSFEECSQPLSVAKGDDLFKECVRTHICAAQAYTCAIKATTAHSTVAQCGQATTICKVTDPIPQSSD